MESEVTTLKAQLEEKEAHLKSIQTQFTEFKEEALEYEKELEADNKHKEKEINSLQAKLDSTTKKLEEYKKEANYLSIALEKEKGKLETTDLNLRESQARIVGLEQDNVSLENEVRNLRHAKEDLQHKFEKLEEASIVELEGLCNEMSHKIEALERLRQEILEYQDEITALRKQNDELQQDRESRDNLDGSPRSPQGDQLKRLEEIIGHYRTEVEILNNGLVERGEQISSYEVQLGVMREEIERLNEELRQKELDEIDEDNELEKTKVEIQILRETLEETDKQIQELNVRLNVSHDQSRDYAYDQPFEKQDMMSSRDIELLKKTLKEMATEMASLNEKLRVEKDANSKLQRENEKLVKEAKAKEKRLASHKTEIAEFKTSLTAERNKTSELEKRLARITREIEDKVKKLSRPAKELPVLKKPIETDRRPQKTPDMLFRDSNPSTPIHTGDLTSILLTEGESDLVAEKLNKMAGDIEVLSNMMVSLQGEKTRLENKIVQREEVIESLTKKFNENNELLSLVHKLTQENNYLSDKIGTIMINVETLANRMSIMQSEKQRLEESVIQRDTLIDDLTRKYQERNGLFGFSEELEQENACLKQKLASMAEDVMLLSSKFIELQEQKRQLELDAQRREAAIDELALRYQELEKALRFYKTGKTGEESLRASPIPKQETNRKELKDHLVPPKDMHLEIEVETAKIQDKSVVALDYQLPKKVYKGFGVQSRVSPTNLTSSYSRIDILDSTTKIEGSKNTTSETFQPHLLKSAKFLHNKGAKNPLSSSVRIDGNQVLILENLSTKNNRGSSGHSVRIEKSLSFNAIIQDPKNMNLKTFNLKEENILGRSLFFFMYGSKGTDKKNLKQNLVQSIIDTFKSISKQHPHKECRVIVRVQDEKLFNKLEASNNYKILERFRNHQEFILGDEQRGPLDDMITQLKQFDIQETSYGAHSLIRDKPTTKEIFIEFLMQNKEEISESISEDCPTYLTRTKIMIVTTNNVKESRELENVTMEDSLVDFILNNKKENNLEKGTENERKFVPNNIEKFFVFSVKPESGAGKNLANTLAAAAVLEDIERLQKAPAITNRKFSTPSPNKTRKGLETFNVKSAPSKRDKFAHLTILQSYETPKGKGKEISFDVKSPDKSSTVKPEKVSAQESQRLVQQIEDYSKMNPAGKSNMKRLLGALTQMTPTNQSYKTKYESKSSISDMSAIITPSRNRRDNRSKAFDFDCPKKEVTVIE